MTANTQDDFMETLDKCLRLECKFEFKSNQEQYPTQTITSQIMYLEEWVYKIYFQQAKIPELYLHYGRFDINLSPSSIAKIIRKIQREACQKQLNLIRYSMTMITQTLSNCHYYKIDSDDSPISYATSNNATQNKNKQIEIASNSAFSNMFYEYSLWTIYQHYCSLSQSNKQVCMLAQIIRQNNDAIRFTTTSDNFSQIFYNSKSSQQKNEQSFSKQMFRQLFKDDDNNEQSIKQQELNMICVGYFVPVLIPALDKKPQILAYLLDKDLFPPQLYNDNIIGSRINKNLGQILDNLDITSIRDELNKIQKVIYWIIYKNKQNMRKYCSYLQQFQEALRLIRNKLYRISKYKCSKDLNLLGKYENLNKKRTLKYIQKYFEDIDQDQIPDCIPIKGARKSDYDQFKQQQQFQKAKAQLQRQINRQRFIFETNESMNRKQIQAKKNDHKKVKTKQICQEVNMTIMDNLNRMEDSPFIKNQSIKNKQSRLLADAESKFRQRVISRGFQSFQFKTKNIQKIEKKQRKNDILDQINFDDIANPLERILSKQDIEISEITHGKSLITTRIYEQYDHDQSSLQKLSFDQFQMNDFRQQNISAQLKNKHKNRINNKLRNLVELQKIFGQKKKNQLKKDFKRKKDEIDLNFDRLDDDKIREILSMNQELRVDNDFDFDQINEEDLPQQKKKKKKNRKKKKKNKNNQQSEQNQHNYQDNVETDLPQVPIQLHKTKSNPDKISISPHLPNDLAFQPKAIDTIKFLFGTKINKQSRAQCFKIDKGTIDRWRRQCENDNFVIENYSSTKSKAKTNRLKSNGRRKN